MLSINVDEVGIDIPEIVDFLTRNHLDSVELRTLRGINFANFEEKEIQSLIADLDKYKLCVSAVASPLFKWYKSTPEHIQPYDSFNFPCILTENDKLDAIKRVTRNTVGVGAKKVRIFTGLNGGVPNPNEAFENDMIGFTVSHMQENGIQAMFENEPVCQIYKFSDCVKMLGKFPNIKLWLDVANFYQVNERISASDLLEVLPRVGHVHLKDFLFQGSEIKHVALGEGDIPWSEMLDVLLSRQDLGITYSVETHVKEQKISATERSIAYFRSKLKHVGS